MTVDLLQLYACTCPNMKLQCEKGSTRYLSSTRDHNILKAPCGEKHYLSYIVVVISVWTLGGWITICRWGIYSGLWLPSMHCPDLHLFHQNMIFVCRVEGNRMGIYYDMVLHEKAIWMGNWKEKIALTAIEKCSSAAEDITFFGSCISPSSLRPLSSSHVGPAQKTAVAG